MPKPQPIWERWSKEKPERMFYIYWAIVIGVNALIFIGAVMFVILLWKR